MGFFEDIAADFGHEAVSSLKFWAKLNTKMASCRNRRIFLLQCKNNHIIPRHIKQNVRCLYTNLDTDPELLIGRITNFNRRLSIKVISMEIRITEHKLHYIQNKIDEIKSKLKSVLPSFIVRNF